MNRGDRREPIFEDDKDRERFLETIAEACEKTDWQTHAYCLMSNHFHLLVETPQANLVPGMKWFLGIEELHEEFGAVERAWCFGGEEFRRNCWRRSRSCLGRATSAKLSRKP
jgi:REP element-mobilizing transposase RayT